MKMKLIGVGVHQHQLIIAGKEVELTLEEAKKLYSELGSVFGPTIAVLEPKYRQLPEVHHHHHPSPTWYEHHRPQVDPNRIMGTLRAS